MASKLLAATTSVFLASMWPGLASSQDYGQYEEQFFEEEQLIENYCDGEPSNEVYYLEDMLSDGELDDLDLFCDELLDYYLDEEIECEDGYDDVCDSPQPLQDLHDKIMADFQNEGDAGHERAISFEELEREMYEANTTLEAVVEEALNEAFGYASLQPTTTWGSGFLNFIIPAAVAQDRGQRMTLRNVKPPVIKRIIAVSNMPSSAG